MKSFPHNLLLFVLFALPILVVAQTDVLHLKSDVVDTIFGKAVPDPYRWMEDMNSDSVKQWLSAQENIANSEKQKFSGRLTIARNDIYAHAGHYTPNPEKIGPWFFYVAKAPPYSGPMPVLYYHEDYLDDFHVAYDPNEIKDGKTYTIMNCALSDSNKYLAVSLSPSNNDWREIRIREIEKKKDLPDKISWVKYSDLAWWKDGFFYTRYQKPKKNNSSEVLSGQQLYYHKLGDGQESDKLLIATANDAHSTINFHKTSNNRYLIVNMQQKINGEWCDLVGYKDLSQGIYGELKLIASTPAKDKVTFKVIDFIDSAFLLLTNYQAPHSRVLRCPFDSANHFTEVIPQYDNVLQEVKHIHHELVGVYFTAGRCEVRMFDYKGKMLSGIKFDEGIAVHGFNGNPDDSVCIFYQNTFYMPSKTFLYNFETRKSALLHQTYMRFDAEEYTTQVVKYLSKDGTEVPMYLTSKKGVKITGSNPVILCDIGGKAAEPFYEYNNIILFDNNGILAVPMIRGGTELGSDWRDAGRGAHIQNSTDDFAAAAEYLFDHHYTTKEHLAVMGKGGSLAGTFMVQHPDLCQAIVDRAGTFDLLRYDKFGGGKYWLNEYGSPEDSADFENLLNYSPLHNLKPNISYPATLLISADNDDRVPAFHSYKFLAALQQCSIGNTPHVLYLEEGGGHAGVSDALDKNYEDAYIIAFIFTEMHLPLSVF